MRRDDWLLAELPRTMTEDQFLPRFLEIFQSVADTVLDQIDALPDIFDPAVAPPRMVREMGRWLGIDWLDSSYSERLQRTIVLEYAQLLPIRGTRDGLERLLRLVSGDDDATVVDSGGIHLQPQGEPRRHVKLSVRTTHHARAEDLYRVVEREIPVGCTFELSVAGTTVGNEGART